MTAQTLTITLMYPPSGMHWTFYRSTHGAFAHLLFPGNRLEAYRPALCALILFARDGSPDMVPPKRNPKAILGNFVAMACQPAPGAVGPTTQAFTVLMAHLLPGSIAVTPGGSNCELLGAVGNYVRPSSVARAPGDPWGPDSQGQSLPMRFGGRFLTRGAVVEVTE